MRVAIGMCGASGILYGVRLLEVLRAAGVETHLVISRWGRDLVQREAGLKVEDIEALASRSYADDDMTAPPASSSFPTDGMVICPATVKTIGEIAGGLPASLISRAADTTLRMGRKLIVCPRETPLSLPCLENLRTLALASAVVMPLSPGFYHGPAKIGDLVDFMAGKILDVLGIPHTLTKRWGLPPAGGKGVSAGGG